MKNKVLIIDDHPLFNDGMALILKESADFKVVGQVYDSRQALYQCRKLNPDLVLIDFNMPHLDGLEVVKQLRLFTQKCKIVIISMYAEPKEVLLFKESGVDGYLPKTIPVKELIKSLREVMEGVLVFTTMKPEKSPLIKDDFAAKYRFSKREVEILKALKAGKNTEQIADSLNLSHFTVSTHRKHINKKLNLKTKQEFYDFLKEFDL